jgi:hypothetical protein
MRAIPETRLDQRYIIMVLWDKNASADKIRIPFASQIAEMCVYVFVKKVQDKSFFMTLEEDSHLQFNRANKICSIVDVTSGHDIVIIHVVNTASVVITRLDIDK